MINAQEPQREHPQKTIRRLRIQLGRLEAHRERLLKEHDHQKSEDFRDRLTTTLLRLCESVEILGDEVAILRRENRALRNALLENDIPPQAQHERDNTKSSPAENPETADLLRGAAAIGAHLTITSGQVYHLHNQGKLPTFKIDSKTIYARKSTLNAWLAEQEAASRRTS